MQNNVQSSIIRDETKNYRTSGSSSHDRRSLRLKSASKGKRGGFRVCYFDDPGREELFLLKIYGKNEKEDLSAAEKKALKEITEMVKRSKHG